MTRISDIPEAELIADKMASAQDIGICQMALDHGINHTSDGFAVRDRLDGNQEIIRKIDAELKRRKVAA